MWRQNKRRKPPNQPDGEQLAARVEETTNARTYLDSMYAWIAAIEQAGTVETAIRSAMRHGCDKAQILKLYMLKGLRDFIFGWHANPDRWCANGDDVVTARKFKSDLAALTEYPIAVVDDAVEVYELLATLDNSDVKENEREPT